MKPSIFNWSGGKDSSLALYKVLNDKEYNIKKLITTVNSKYNRISMHGVREILLDRQAQEIGLPLHKIMVPEQPTMEEYDALMKEFLGKEVANGVEHSIFGDIFLEDLKKYREDKLAEVGLQGVFPIWKRDTKELIKEFIEQGFKTIIVCVQAELLDESFAGRVIDENFLSDLPENVDPCGENGEFHTFVYDGPIFRNPIKFELGDLVHRNYNQPNSDGKLKTGFYFKDIIPA